MSIGRLLKRRLEQRGVDRRSFKCFLYKGPLRLSSVCNALIVHLLVLGVLSKRWELRSKTLLDEQLLEFARLVHCC